MQTRFIARRVELTDDLRGYIEKHVNRVAALVSKDDSVEARVVLSSEKFRYTAEVTLFADGFSLNAKEETKDIRASVDGALDKLVRQVKKKKARLARHQPMTAREARTVGHHVLAAETDLEEPAGDVTEDMPRFVRRESLPVKPMGLAEALMQLDLIDEDFLVFWNADTDQVNVVYTRKDGYYGLIEPGF